MMFMHSTSINFIKERLSQTFLRQVLSKYPYTIEYNYYNNGTEYKGTPDYDFVALSKAYGIWQKFTRVKLPQINGKSERIIQTLMEIQDTKHILDSR